MSETSTEYILFPVYNLVFGILKEYGKQEEKNWKEKTKWNP